MKKCNVHILLLLLSALVLAGCASQQKSATITVEEESDPSPQALEHFIRGVVYDQQGEPTLAIAEYRRALRYDSTSASIHLALAEDYYSLKLIDDAKDQLNTAYSLDSTNSEVLTFLAEIFARSNQLDSAVD